MKKIKVWDLPVRICHLLLILLIAFQYLSAEILTEDWIPNPIQLHFYAGYACLGVIIFRILWGFLGTKYAKFNNFIKSPMAIVKYLNNNDKKHYLGHNPLGALSVIALLLVILVQAATGLFISDQIFSDGPYYGVLSSYWQGVVNFLHHNVFNLLLGFIGVHIAAIIYYKLKKNQALTQAMISGYKKLDKEDIEQESGFPWLGFLLCLGITCLLMYLIIVVLAPPPADDFYM